MNPRFQRYAGLLRSRRYPVWSVRSATAFLVVIAGISALVIGLLPDLKNIFVRMELVLAICAVALFWLMAVGLYRGARVRRKDLPQMRFGTSWSADDAQQTGLDIGSAIDLPVDADFGCMGIILAFIIWLAMLLFGGLIIWALVQFGGWAIVGFLFGLSWVVYRALRQVFARSRECQGKLFPSLSWAMIYTALYTAWLFALLLLGSWVTTRR